MDSTKFLEEEKITALLWKFSVPAVTGMVVSALYNIVDSIFVGRGVGELALTAVTIAFPVMTVLMAVGMLVGIGAATLVSISLGQKQQEKAERVLGNAVSMMIIIVLVSTGLTLWFLDAILIDLLGVTPDVLPYARDFITIILAGSVFLHVGFGINNVIRAQGDPKTALSTQLISALVNVVLNYVLVFVIPMGIKGAAYATIMAQAVAAIWVLAYFLKGPSLLRLRIKNLKLDKQIVVGICKIGIAPFVMQVGASAVMVVLNLRIMEFGGNMAVAAYGVVNRVMLMIMMPVAGISQGAQPIIGYNYGARQFHRVIETLHKAIAVSTMICIFGFAAVELFAAQIVEVFNNEPNLILYGTTGMKIYLCMLPIIGFQLIGANYFQAVGKAAYSIVFNLLRQILVLIPMVYILSHYFGLIGIWAAGPVSDFASALLTAACLWTETRQYKNFKPNAGKNAVT